jgi:hypothetical protein
MPSIAHHPFIVARHRANAVLSGRYIRPEKAPPFTANISPVT